MQSFKIAFIVLLSAICALARITEELQGLATTLTDTCHEELGGELPQDFGARMTQEYIELKSEAAKCHIHCLSVKLGTIHEDGTINKEKMTEILLMTNPDDKVKRFVKVCDKLTVGETKCQRAYSVYECWHKNKQILDEVSKA